MIKKTIFITGATSGIGKATAELLGRQGHRLILHGRNEKKLEALVSTIEADEVMNICFDIQKKEAVLSALNQLSDSWKDIDVLINNAGLSLDKSSFHKCLINDWDTMLQTNVSGLLYVSHYIVNLMLLSKKEKERQIINISSIAGTQVYKGGNVYCASKHAVDAITKSMRVDLLEEGIKVSSISPGNVKTNFSNVRFKNDLEKANSVYKGYDPLLATDIAEVVDFILSRPPHVNINDIEVTPRNQANAFYLVR